MTPHEHPAEHRANPAAETPALHPDAVETVRSNLPDDEFLYDLAELFKVFGDSTRIKAVSYTHLDVYKRQLLHSRRER